MLIPNPSTSNTHDDGQTKVSNYTELESTREAVAPEAVAPEAIAATEQSEPQISQSAPQAQSVPTAGVPAPGTATEVIPPQPTTSPVNFAAIPALLKAQPHWLVWRYTLGKPNKKGECKWTKVPYHSDNVKADVTQISACESLDVVKARYEAGEVAGVRFDGVGFSLTENLGIVGVDMDEQRLADGTWSADVLDQVAALGTYGEVSPSGVGVRFFGLGTLAEKGCKRGKFEIYDGARYLTVTGRRLEGAAAEILECGSALRGFQTKYVAPAPNTQRPSDFFSETPFASKTARAETAALSDEELLERIGKSRKAGKFRALWEGDDSGHKGDVSAGDLALCNKLAYWTGKDAARIDGLFRQSKRMRPKWDQLHYAGGVTYGAHTIGLAIASCRKTYDPATPEFPPLQVENIPAAPAGGAGGKPVYGAYWIAKMLYPEWDVAGLDTNRAHALRLQAYLGKSLCYSQLGWMHFNGKFWEIDDKDASRTTSITGRLSRQVRAEATQLYYLSSLLSKAGREGDAAAMSAAASSHGSHARRVESFKFIQESLRLAAGEVRVDIARFDPKPWILGFENGVWDHGTWRAHRREDFLLHLSPVEIDFNVDSSEWDEVLSRMTAGDGDLARTLQELAGYILSGTASMRLIAWAYGEGGTGKSTYSELLQTMLGKNSTPIAPTKLDRRADRERVGANLWNRRLAICAEAGHKQIEAELLKTLSGGDTMTVRLLYKEVFDALPRHVLLLVSNDPPRLDAYDAALKDRMLVLPFVHLIKQKGLIDFDGGPDIVSARQNPEALLVRGFAVWALAGLAQMQGKHEVYRAPAIQQATEKFWADTDQLTEFWESIDVEDLKRGVMSDKLRQLYKNWCQKVDMGSFSPMLFNKVCRDKGLRPCRLTRHNHRGWRLPSGSSETFDSETVAPEVDVTVGPFNIYGTPVVKDDVSWNPDLCVPESDPMAGVTIEAILSGAVGREKAKTLTATEPAAATESAASDGAGE